ncbi:MAG: NUDIX hydrolase [Gammaproteobacteria bacterium]|nr:NUDIX hydrolase [Gammaproteobacteria bacterium]
MRPVKTLLTAIAACFAAVSVHAADFPDGYWSTAQARQILDKTLRVHLAPPLDSLTQAEQGAVQKLLETGVIMQRLYEESRHPDALAAYEELLSLHRSAADPERSAALLDLYRLSNGPITTTLDNEREPFLPVVPETAGKNVYPASATRHELTAAMQGRPELRAPLLHPRSIVRSAARENLYQDIMTLKQRPVLDVLHPGLLASLVSVRDEGRFDSFYALPYSVAYADDLLRSHDLLHDAAMLLAEDDPAFARFLKNRARDLLTDHYEAGDASWVTGRFRNVNAQIGSYETYDDQLFGVKTFFGLSLLKRDQQRSTELAAAVTGLQNIEDELPYESTRRVRSEIPIGVYDVIADFGQARGANTATILPNESYLARQYGRTILLRANILTHPRIYARARASFDAAIDTSQHADLTQESNLYRTLWHEIGHYLGADLTEDGRDLGVALGDSANLFEELKSDLIALHAVRTLTRNGFYTRKQARAVYASGIRRVLQKNRPRRDQPYQTMQLMQWNWFLENGVLRFDSDDGRMRINYNRYHDAVRSLLADVLKIQVSGDPDAAETFVASNSGWRDELHGVVASNMKAAETYRYTLVSYQALGDAPDD